MNRFVNDVKRNIDKKTFYTGLAVFFASGALLYAMNKSNIKVLKTAASVAKGGK